MEVVADLGDRQAGRGRRPRADRGGRVGIVFTVAICGRRLPGAGEPQ